MTRADAWPHTAAILAGGASRRFGRRKEHLELPDGRTMIERLAGVLASCATRVVIVGATDALPELTHVHDRRSNCGPLAGIEALLASDIDDEYLVCPCDLPLVEPRTLAPLLTTTLDDGPTAGIVFHVSDEADARPLPMRVHVRALTEVQRLLDDDRRAIRALLDVAPFALVSLAEAAALDDVDTEEDARRLCDRDRRLDEPPPAC